MLPWEAPGWRALGSVPQRDGAHSATLTLTTNDADLPTVSYPLACTGEASEPATSATLYLPLIAR